MFLFTAILFYFSKMSFTLTEAFITIFKGRTTSDVLTETPYTPATEASILPFMNFIFFVIVMFLSLRAIAH